MMKKRIRTLVINLPSSRVRREYMEETLSGCDNLDVTFVDAVDGRILSEKERQELFDYGRSLKHYGRVLNNGEVGCALSHRKCYRSLLDSSEPYVLVMEDDISLIRDFNALPFDAIDAVLRSEKPAVLFLSGDYWMFSRRKAVTRVFDAVGGYAYFINRAAARKILSIGKPYTVADDWGTHKRLGIRLFAVYPYAVDANVDMDRLPSDVCQESWTNDHGKMSRYELLKLVCPSIIKKLMKKVGLFESKIRVVDNKIVIQ